MLEHRQEQVPPAAHSLLMRAGAITLVAVIAGSICTMAPVVRQLVTGLIR